MARLPLTLGLFLAVSVATVVFLLGLVAKVTIGTLIARTLGSFLALGVLGVVLGSVLEIVLMPEVTEHEQQRVRDEMAIKNEAAVRDLGDLLSPPADDTKDGKEFSPKRNLAAAGGASIGGFVPVSFPRVEVRNANESAPRRDLVVERQSQPSNGGRV